MKRLDPRPRLYGRRRECDALDRLVRRVHEGRSSVFVLRGATGVGQTALLEYLTSTAAGCRVERVAGVESETSASWRG